MLGKSEIAPIGFLHTSNLLKFEVPHQPDLHSTQSDRIELLPNLNLELALSDLENFEMIWVISWFHKNKTWNPKVLPPRGPEKKRGVFSTRSPHRPNPIGLTACKLLKIQGLNIFISGSDLIDGTPILDIKPYLPKVDAHTDVKYGWVEELEDELTVKPNYNIELSNFAKEQRSWLIGHAVDPFQRAIEILTIDPLPNKTRRIKKLIDNKYRIACGAFRIFFTIENQTVLIERMIPGYPLEKVTKADAQIPYKDLQREFYDKGWY